ncbi:hypothetical protein RF11_04237 [Thelohanellus kitauei]|uniref:Uncharacterized protein n=1 Tax=Thelohanellus kitauei TaxID=669202 RepID=A0A0C2IRK4_THEKT|nr:hypothetical protein RF11_04237 [Thelohanellus kitauei]
MESSYTNNEDDVQKEGVYMNNLQTFVKYDKEIVDQLSALFGSPVLIERQDCQVDILPCLLIQRKSWFKENWHKLLHLILFVMLFSKFYKIMVQQNMINDLNSQLDGCPDY